MAQQDTQAAGSGQTISREAVIAIRNRAITLALIAAREGDSQRYATAQGMATAAANILSVGQLMADMDHQSGGYTAPRGWERTWASLPNDGQFPRLGEVLNRLLTEEAGISDKFVTKSYDLTAYLREHSVFVEASAHLDQKAAVPPVDLAHDQSLLHVASDAQTAIVAKEGGAA